MAELTPEERQRIYLEEKARQEAQQQIQKEQTQKTLKGCYGCLGVFVAGFIVLMIIALFNTNKKETESETITLHALYERTTTQIKITNIDAFEWTNIEFRLNPTLTDAYEYHLSSLKPGETAIIGLLNFTKSNGARFNPFQLTVKEIHIIAQTEQGEGATGFRWTN